MKKTILAGTVTLALLFCGSVHASDFHELALYQYNVSATDEEPEETENYNIMKIAGFTVMVSGDALYKRPEDMDKALWILRAQLVMVNDVLENWFLAISSATGDMNDIYQIEIWLDDSRAGDEERGCESLCFYSVSRSQLKSLDINPDKAGAVGITDIDYYINSMWCCSGAMFHELAHGWHYHVIPDGYDNEDIETGYENAKDSGLYDDVLNLVGDTVDEAYAMTSHREYFAQLSTSLWHKTFEYPFNFGELSTYDKASFNNVLDGWLWPDSIRTSRPATRSTQYGLRDDEVERRYQELLSQHHLFRD